jgi:hypothetical protein
MNDVTSLSDLQMDPIGGKTTEPFANISMTATEQQTDLTHKEDVVLDESTVHLLINGLQKAASSGSTKLPSRDMPMMPSQYTNDPEIIPTYIPIPKKNYDYIEEEDMNNNIIIQKYNKKLNRSEQMDDFYNEIQMPLLLSVLYFLLQLPFFKKLLFHYLPALFSKDGNINLYGYGFTSFLFGLIYYIVNKIGIMTVQLGNFM